MECGSDGVMEGNGFRTLLCQRRPPSDTRLHDCADHDANWREYAREKEKVQQKGEGGEWMGGVVDPPSPRNDWGYGAATWWIDGREQTILDGRAEGG
jgi:hypothetical protein